MRNRSLYRRLVSLLLVFAMMLTLCACGARPGEESGEPAETAENGERPAPTVNKEDADKYMHNDPAIAKHIAHNAVTVPVAAESREATEFHMYVANTETMQGFVNAKRVTAYQDGVQCAFDAAYNMFDQLYGHSMSAQGWGEEEVDDLLMRDILSPSFYTLALPMDGALAPLFRRDTPFYEDGLTVIVSNFVEPGFDLSFLSSGIQQYFDNYSKSAACVIGFTSYFEGRFHIPQNYRSEDRSTFYIDRFTGDVPCYMVVVGPEASVNQYTEMLFKHLENRQITYDWERYSNSVYEEVFANPLVFDVIPDQKLPKATAPLTSYNTGTLTEHAEGGAFFATYSSVETRDGSAEEGKSSRGSKNEETSAEAAGVKVSKSSQISLISRNYVSGNQYDYDYTLYIYDKSAKQWVDAGKNAWLMATVKVEPQKGPFKDTKNKDYVILAEDREEMYVSARLDFGTDDILSRDDIYRLEVRLHLNQPTFDDRNQEALSALAHRSINTAEYFSVMDDMSALYNDNYVWTGTYQSVRDVALRLFAHTPNLDSLLLNLRDMEKQYETHTEMFTYLDFVFNIRDKDSRR